MGWIHHFFKILLTVLSGHFPIAKCLGPKRRLNYSVKYHLYPPLDRRAYGHVVVVDVVVNTGCHSSRV